MANPVGLNERLQLRRWLAAVGLTGAAEEAAHVDTAETNAMALLGAHAACEALLGLLAGVRRHKPGDEVAFGRLLESAAAKVALTPDLADNLDAMHRIRNDFVHASNTVAADEAARAIFNARRLMELVPASLGASWNLPTGAGLGSAVAEIIQVEAVGMWLRHADEMLGTGRVQLAADGLARALQGAIARAHPSLLPPPKPDSALQLRRAEAGFGADGDDERAVAAIAGLHRWVLPLALGTSPAAYGRLLGIIGVVPSELTGGQPGPVTRPRDAVVGVSDVRRAISQTAEIIFRLWAMGSLRPWRNDDKVVESAQSFLANPSGRAAGEPPPAGRREPQR